VSRLPILVYGHPCLRRVAAPVGRVTEGIRGLVRDMTDTMYDAPGRGLAAPQVGRSLRVFVIDCHWKDGAPRDPLAMIDPQILWRSDSMATREEGCLSIPDLPMAVARPDRIRIAWTDPEGRAHEATFGGIEAVCVQHEHDHLDGILIPDRAAAEDRATHDAALAVMAERGGTV